MACSQEAPWTLQNPLKGILNPESPIPWILKPKSWTSDPELRQAKGAWPSLCCKSLQQHSTGGLVRKAPCSHMVCARLVSQPQLLSDATKEDW